VPIIRTNNCVYATLGMQSYPKHVQKRNKHVKKKLCTKLALFIRLYRDVRSTNHKKRT
jgi:hypothetical protein